MAAEIDVLVVGAGPAGMSAALESARWGLSVMVVDEQPAPGGQIYRNVERASARVAALLGPEYARGRRLTSALGGAPVDYRSATTLWHLTPELEAGLVSAGRADFVRAQRVVLATGAMERPFPIPGWTLPGVVTAGAAQIALKTADAVPDGNVVIAGTGPLLYLVAAQLVRAGAPPRALLDTTPRQHYARALRHLPAALRAPAYLAKGLGLIGGLRRHGLRIERGVVALEATGGSRLEAVRFRASGGEVVHDIAADWLLLHQGVAPNIQATQALGCRHRWDSRQLCWRPELDEWGETSLAGLLVAGDGGGIGGAIAAEHSGRLCGLRCAEALGAAPAGEARARAAPMRRALRRHLAVRPFLDVLYRPPDAFRVPADDATIVCRCEDVSASDIRRWVDLGATGPNQTKFFSRCGMGPCQGRLCGLTVTELIAAHRGVTAEEVGYYRVRPPIKPVSLGALAGLARGADAVGFEFS